MLTQGAYLVYGLNYPAVLGMTRSIGLLKGNGKSGLSTWRHREDAMHAKCASNFKDSTWR